MHTPTPARLLNGLSVSQDRLTLHFSQGERDSEGNRGKDFGSSEEDWHCHQRY